MLAARPTWFGMARLTPRLWAQLGKIASSQIKDTALSACWSYLSFLLRMTADNGFANFINGLSAPFVALFANLVQNPALSTTAVLEVTTVIAMIVYAIVAWLVVRAKRSGDVTQQPGLISG